MSKEFGHLPVSINDYFDRSLKNKNSTGFPDFKLIEASIFKGNNTLGSRSAYIILWTSNHPIHEQENNGNSGNYWQ